MNVCEAMATTMLTSDNRQGNNQAVTTHSKATTKPHKAHGNNHALSDNKQGNNQAVTIYLTSQATTRPHKAHGNNHALK